MHEVGVRIAAETGDARSTRQRPPLTVAAAHDRVLAMQEPLLRGGERVGPAKPGAASRRTRVRHDPESIPLPRWQPRQSEEQWQERVNLAIQRAHDLAQLYEREAQTKPDSLAQEERRLARSLREREQYLRDQARRLFPNSAPYTPRTAEVPAGGRLDMGRVTIDLDADQLLVDGRAVAVAPTPRAYAAVLLANEGRFVTQAALVQLARAEDRLSAMDSISTQIRNLRRSTDDALVIATAPGAFGVFRDQQALGREAAEGVPSAGPARLDPESNRRAWHARAAEEIPPCRPGPRTLWPAPACRARDPLRQLSRRPPAARPSAAACPARNRSLRWSGRVVADSAQASSPAAPGPAAPTAAGRSSDRLSLGSGRSDRQSQLLSPGQRMRSHPPPAEVPGQVVREAVDGVDVLRAR